MTLNVRLCKESGSADGFGYFLDGLAKESTTKESFKVTACGPTANGFKVNGYTYSLVPFFANTTGVSAITELYNNALANKTIVTPYKDKSGEHTGESVTEKFSVATITCESIDGGPSIRFRMAVKLEHIRANGVITTYDEPKSQKPFRFLGNESSQAVQTTNIAPVTFGTPT